MIRALLKISLLILFLSQYSSLIKAQENILEADKIEYINKDGKVFAKGSVLLIREGYKLEADEVAFDPSNNIIEAVGKIRIEESNGNIITASRIKLSADLSDGLIELPRITTKDGTSLSSAYAIRSNNKATILRKGIFSPCKACKNENKRISWQVKANRIIHDEENGNIIYEGARFELFGVPIFYVSISVFSCCFVFKPQVYSVSYISIANRLYCFLFLGFWFLCLILHWFLFLNVVCFIVCFLFSRILERNLLFRFLRHIVY